ncbi:hypothetical protein NQD34_012407 [Periophthalmus magnuspinnatus]|nr:hypothetical protein NQD34_012407 [Periophthalmus magnuspinnatus]
MEEDVQYISVVFKNNPPPQTGNKDQQSIYSEVKIKPESAVSPGINNAVEGPKSSAPASNLCILTSLILCLCVLLGSTTGLIYLSISTTNQRSENQRLSSEMSLLQEESVRLKSQRAELQNLTHNLGQLKDQLNWTLQVVLSFSQFPVSDFCPNKECRPCLDGWLLFQSSCYLFYESKLWKTWMESQTYCRQNSTLSGLVVVNSLQEQEFIHDHIKYYYDHYHGYWIGLSDQDQHWVWDDGQVDTLGFWMNVSLGTPGPKVLIIPDQNVTQSWDPADNNMQNKFICESKALTIE